MKGCVGFLQLFAYICLLHGAIAGAPRMDYFPERHEYTMARDPGVSDDDLIHDRTVVEPFQCRHRFLNSVSCLDYSALVRKPYSELKETVLDIGNYAVTFKSAGVLESEVIEQSQGNPNNLIIYIRFILGFGIPVSYFMDAELVPGEEDGNSFGYRFQQDEVRQNQLPFNVIPRQTGAWYIEKFGSEPDVYYVRLRGAVEFSLDVMPEKLIQMIAKRTKDIYKVMGKEQFKRK